MADLQLTAIPSVSEASSGLALPPGSSLRSPSFETMQQTVLKRVDSAEDSGRISPPQVVIEATRQVVDMITALRSPQSGCPPEVASNPEAIAPYVTEEVQDVLAALQSVSLSPPSEALKQPWNEVPLQPYGLVQDLVPWMLWCVARSTYETMRLLEGIAARVYQPSWGWQQGILRLAVILDIKTPDLTWSVDLATQEAPLLFLPLDARVQALDYNLGHQPVEVGSLLQQITTQIRSTTEAMGQLFDQATLEVLVPHQVWHSGTVQCHLGFEFVSEAVDHSANRLITPHVVLSEADPASLAQPASSTPLLTFTETEWVERYQEAIANQQFVHLITQSQTLQPGMLGHLVSELDIIQAACQLLETWQNFSDSRNFPQEELGLDELVLRILWCFSRTSYPIMQLLGGISVSLLQPAYPWEKGILRFMVTLRVKTPEVDWHIDLATGLPPAPNVHPLHPQGMVRFNEAGWGNYPIPMSQLRDQVWEGIQASTPEIQLLVQGTGVDLLDADHHWQAGAIQLQAEFEFTPQLSVTNHLLPLRPDFGR